jgi:hypothetical protein
MSFLNLSAGEFLALMGALGGLITALYLLDRAKRKKIVSTFRFWTSASVAQEKQTRKRMREPWSLILQLVSLLLLLLAIAQLEWGGRESKVRSHVVLLDTSAWSGAVTPKGSSVIEREKRAARQYIGTISESDRVMIVFADALATPATAFTTDRVQLRRVIAEAEPGYSSLNLEQVLSYAQQAQQWSGSAPGELVYIGPKRIDTEEITVRVPKLRVVDVPCDCEDTGILRVGVKRVEGSPSEWAATVSVKNYGDKSRVVRLRTRFGGTPLAARTLTLLPRREATADYVFDTSSSGQFVAEIDSPDALLSDNKVALTLPRVTPLRVAVFTARPDVLRPLFEAAEQVSSTFHSPAQYTPNPSVDLVVLDQMSPAQPPQVPSLWIEPPRERSPLPVKAVIDGPVITRWNANSPVAAGLHATETRLVAAEVFHVFDGDTAVASLAEGPVVVVRGGTVQRPKLAVIGFDPLAGEMKFQVTTPLLFANVLHWLSPQSLITLDIQAARVGTASVQLDPSERADHVGVASASGEPMPFIIHDQTLEFFASKPSEVHIATSNGERIISVTLPHVAEHVWIPSPKILTGAAPGARSTASSVDLWRALAVFGGIGLIAEWMLFGFRGVVRRRKEIRTVHRSTTAQKRASERELVTK